MENVQESRALKLAKDFRVGTETYKHAAYPWNPLLRRVLETV